MITQKSVKGTFTASLTAYGDSTAAQIYTSERNLLYVQFATKGMKKILTSVGNYYTDSNGLVKIDISDYVRTLKASGQLYMEDESGNDYTEFLLIRCEGIYPNHLLLPPPPFLFGEDTKDEVQILPPSVVYIHPLLSLYYETAIQVHGIGERVQWWAQYKQEPTDIFQLHVTGGMLTLPIYNAMADKDWAVAFFAEIDEQLWATLAVLYGGRFTDTAFQVKVAGALQYRTHELRECESACVLRWVGESGVYKQAVWRVKKVHKTASSRDLLIMGDGYKTQRGQAIEFTAFIDGLDAYDYAYYADIITSKDVHCALYTGEDLTQEETAVAISNNDYTQPDGDAGNLQTLEIVIKYRHYDTL